MIDSILSTGFQLILLGLATFMTWRAGQHAERCLHEARRIIESRSRIVALEAEVEQLDKRLRKLSGTVHKELRGADGYRGDEATLAAIAALPTPFARANLPVCENWEKAKLEGPRSAAAACDCPYCTQQRCARAADKAVILASRGIAAKPVNGGE